MNAFLIIVLVVATILLISNWQSIRRLLTPPKPKAPPEQINTGEIALIKPAGFYRPATTTQSFAIEIYSEKKAGVIGMVDGRSVQEEFNHVWAVVSVTLGDGLELCRNVAKQNVEAILNEVEGQVGRDRMLTIEVVKRSAHFQMETTHKVIVSSDRQKTYELRASVLSEKKAEYADAMAEILNSFNLVPTQ